MRRLKQKGKVSSTGHRGTPVNNI